MEPSPIIDVTIGIQSTFLPLETIASPSSDPLAFISSTNTDSFVTPNARIEYGAVVNGIFFDSTPSIVTLMKYCFSKLTLIGLEEPMMTV